MNLKTALKLGFIGVFASVGFKLAGSHFQKRKDLVTKLTSHGIYDTTSAKIYVQGLNNSQVASLLQTLSSSNVIAKPGPAEWGK